MGNPRKICVVTGTRAEYGLLKWIMSDIRKDQTLTLQLIATAMHLSPEFGSTYREIEEDGFAIDSKLEVLLSSDTSIGISKSIGLGIISFAEEFARLRPDVIVLLGDRFEILAAAVAATIAQIPIAHLHGGETTEGVIDESIRHSITKMSHLHFASTEVYRKRIIQLGEQPDRVFNVGATGLEAFNRIMLMNKKSLEKSLDFEFGEQNFLVTYHPVTLLARPEEDAFKEVLMAFEEFPKAKYIITYPNADTDGRKIIEMQQLFARKYPDRVYLTQSLGQLRYLSTIQFVDAVIGNSSSALIEVPSLHIPSINIGIRQQGRIAPDTVLHCDEKREPIVKAMRKALSPQFKALVKTIENPYGDGCVAQKVIQILKIANLKEVLIKKFNDLEILS